MDFIAICIGLVLLIKGRHEFTHRWLTYMRKIKFSHPIIIGDGQDDNPFSWEDVCKNIELGLIKDGYKRGVEYEIMMVPNIVNIT